MTKHIFYIKSVNALPFYSFLVFFGKSIVIQWRKFQQLADFDKMNVVGPAKNQKNQGQLIANNAELYFPYQECPSAPFLLIFSFFAHVIVSVYTTPLRKKGQGAKKYKNTTMSVKKINLMSTLPWIPLKYNIDAQIAHSFGIECFALKIRSKKTSSSPTLTWAKFDQLNNPFRRFHQNSFEISQQLMINTHSNSHRISSILSKYKYPGKVW